MNDLGTLVRDLTKVGSISKSQARARIEAYAHARELRLLEEVQDKSYEVHDTCIYRECCSSKTDKILSEKKAAIEKETV